MRLKVSVGRSDFERKAVHGPRHVHDEYVVARGDLRRGNAFRRLDHGEEVLLVAVLVQHQAGFDAAAGELVTQDEIPVATVAAFLEQLHVGAVGVTIGHAHLV
jgi:hypothetical protein